MIDETLPVEEIMKEIAKEVSNYFKKNPFKIYDYSSLKIAGITLGQKMDEKYMEICSTLKLSTIEEIYKKFKKQAEEKNIDASDLKSLETILLSKRLENDLKNKNNKKKRKI